MIKILTVFGAATLLVGCSATAANWNKPGASAAEAQRDSALCQHEAEMATPPVNGIDPINAGVQEGLRISRLREQCLALRGYTRG